MTPPSHSERLIPWRMSEEIYQQVKYWGRRASDATYLSAEWHEATDALKSLPGFPADYSPAEGDVLVCDVIDKISTTMVH